MIILANLITFCNNNLKGVCNPLLSKNIYLFFAWKYDTKTKQDKIKFGEFSQPCR